MYQKRISTSSGQLFRQKEILEQSARSVEWTSERNDYHLSSRKLVEVDDDYETKPTSVDEPLVTKQLDILSDTKVSQWLEQTEADKDLLVIVLPFLSSQIISKAFI